MEEAMNTHEIMNVALELAGLSEIPPDSGILVPGDKIKKAMIGLDIDTPEILLAKQLGVDVVIGHHPAAGNPYVNFSKVMLRQIDCMVSQGVPINKAQRALAKRKESVDIAHHVGNYDRASQAAKLLHMPYMNIHLPADIITNNIVSGYLYDRLGDKPKAMLKDVVAVLQELPEYQWAMTEPVIRIGSPDYYAGKIYVAMAGGTSGGAAVAKAYFEAGVGTLVMMHMPEPDIKELREYNLGNLIVAGHVASDSIGLNKLIAALEGQGLEIIRINGIVSTKDCCPR
jgi:putative NIF3 family GTP cyclohydrolase 1 type 2